MTRYLVRRLIESAITVLFASVLIFLILHLSPGGPFDNRVAGRAIKDPTYLDRLNKLVGLDKPIHERYLDWASRLVRGDWGTSWSVSQGKPVIGMIMERLPNTVELMASALLLSLIIAMVVGIVSAVKQYSWFDYLATALSFGGISLPTFWFGLQLIFIFGLWLHWLPIAGLYTPGHQNDWVDRIQHIIMPVMVLSIIQVAQWSRFIRSSMLEVLRQDYVRTANAKGLGARAVLLRHTLRNALIPLITVVAIAIPNIFGGAIITETIFAWPGMGRLYFDAVSGSDWPVAMGLLIITALLVVLSNLLADVLYAVVDPRIRYA